MAKKSFSIQVNRDPSMTRYVIGMRTPKPAPGQQKTFKMFTCA